MVQGDRTTVERTERWFVAQGLPHFISDYSASQDIFTRAAPLLSLIFLFEVFGALNLEWVWWANVLAVLGGMALLTVGLALVNRSRGRPMLSRPRTIGVVEIAGFVLLPAILPLVFGGQLQSALTTIAGNLLVLGVIYLVTSYALIPMLRWALRRFFKQFGDLFDLLVRSLPLLLLFVTFLFITAEVWQVAASLTGGAMWGVVILFVAVGVLFLATRLPEEIGRLSRFESANDVASLAKGTPVADLAASVHPSEAVKLSKRQWSNVGLVVLFSQGVQILLVSVLIGLFIIGFGLLALNTEIVQSWAQVPPHELVSFTVGNHEVVLTEELLRVAGFLASISGLYFTVSALTDATYREEFYEEVVQDVRRAFAVREVYLDLIAQETGPTTQPG